MIRKIALEVVLALALLYGLADVRDVLVHYDPIDEVAGTVASSGGAFTELPPRVAPSVSGEKIFAKNLFHPSRKGFRPPPPKPKPTPRPAPPPPPPPSMPKITLKGIIETPSGERKALLEVEGDRARSARAGDTIGEFEVVDITVLEVKLLWNGEPVTINIRNQPETAPASKPAAGRRPGRRVHGRRR